MAVPSQQDMHRPILEITSKAHDEIVSLQQIKEALIQRFSLDHKDLAERVPSGQNRFTNRLHWAVSYLRRAGLLHSPSKASFRITEPGFNILSSQSGDLGTAQLKGLIDAGSQQTHQDVRETVQSRDTSGVTPDEQVGDLHDELNDKLADELLDSVRKVSPDQFERLMVSLLEKMGYGKGRAVGQSGDGGIDGIIHQDRLGLGKVYIQAKRWQSGVGEPEIRNFSGSLQAKGASTGVFITTSNFVPKALETADRISAGPQFIRLIAGAELSRLMIEYDVGVVTETTYHVKKVDENYFVKDV